MEPIPKTQHLSPFVRSIEEEMHYQRHPKRNPKPWELKASENPDV
jgi:hypothetical protein